MNDEYPATVTVHTPTGPVDCCPNHALMLKNLMSFMGAHVGTTNAAEGAQCSNCVNEQKARK